MQLLLWFYKGWGPYAFFKALEESYANTQVSRPPPTHVGEVEIGYVRNNDLGTGSSLDDSHMSIDDDLEYGR